MNEQDRSAVKAAGLIIRTYNESFKEYPIKDLQNYNIKHDRQGYSMSKIDQKAGYREIPVADGEDLAGFVSSVFKNLGGLKEINLKNICASGSIRSELREWFRLPVELCVGGCNSPFKEYTHSGLWVDKGWNKKDALESQGFRYCDRDVWEIKL